MKVAPLFNLKLTIMHLESTCIDMSAEKIQAILERSKPINYKWLISKIRKHLPELYSDLCLDFYNPYKEWES